MAEGKLEAELGAGDRLHIVGLRVECIVGILPEERVREQTLELNLDLHVSTAPAAASGKITDTLDYDRIAHEVSALLRFRRYRLLEMAAEEVAAMLLGVHDRLVQVELRVLKPRALEGRAEAAGVSICRRDRDFPRGQERNEFGEVEILLENADAGLYLLHVDPGRSIPAHHHRVMRELEWLVQGELERDGVQMGGFDPVVWPRERVHEYTNRSSSRATLFCCDSPPFVPEDEVLVGRTPTERRAGS
jgi:dihydroneopterin aldolase